MKKTIIFGLLSGLLVVLVGYAQEEREAVANPEITLQEEVPAPPKPAFNYHSGNRRDPFMPLVRQRVAARKVGVVGEIDIITLSLSGIIWDEEEALALLHDGGNFGYILKRGRLLKENYQPIDGVFGKIKADAVYLTQGKTRVRLTLGEEE